jgi:hypothetical protein
MNNTTDNDERILGEAHLYIAVAMADGSISQGERRRAGGLLKKSRLLHSIIVPPPEIEKKIDSAITALLRQPRYEHWSAEDHLNEAIEKLKTAQRSGEWDINLSAVRHEKSLYELAYIDGYGIRESRFVKKMIDRLKKL